MATITRRLPAGTYKMFPVFYQWIHMEIEIQTLDRGEAIISTIGIPFPVSTRIHYYEDYIAGLNKEK
ncbi:MAG: hypothetical protein ABFC71_10995, partial [Methanoregula sp.]